VRRAFAYRLCPARLIVFRRDFCYRLMRCVPAADDCIGVQMRLVVTFCWGHRQRLARFGQGGLRLYGDNVGCRHVDLA
jgi:hypothetical protein